MRQILISGAEAERKVFTLEDPDGFAESRFEYLVARALGQAYPGHHLAVFSGSFRYDNRINRPDLALVARDFSHWYVIEVELTSHSLERHVLPQVRAFQYGDPEPDCARALARELAIDEARARTLVDLVPRGTVVVANRWEGHWALSLGACSVALLAVSVFRGTDGTEAFGLEGSIGLLSRSLGFGAYVATERSLVFPEAVDLPVGEVLIENAEGVGSLWTVRREGRATWVTKSRGVPAIAAGVYMQLVRTVDGRLTLRRPCGPRG